MILASGLGGLNHAAAANLNAASAPFGLSAFGVKPETSARSEHYRV